MSRKICQRNIPFEYIVSKNFWQSNIAVIINLIGSKVKNQIPTDIENGWIVLRIPVVLPSVTVCNVQVLCSTFFVSRKVGEKLLQNGIQCYCPNSSRGNSRDKIRSYLCSTWGVTSDQRFEQCCLLSNSTCCSTNCESNSSLLYLFKFIRN